MARNKEDVYKLLGASNHCKDDREENDFYSTDPDCVRDLLKVETFSNTILEPCCGTGNISKVLEEAGYSVTSTDLIDRGYGRGGIDFFKEYHIIDCDIVTNPPFGLATEFVDKCLHDMTPNHKLALFLKLQFLEGQDRFNKIYKLGHLKKIYIYSKRVACYKNDEMWQKNDDGSFKLDRNGNKIKTQSAVCYAWYIFDLSYNGKPEIDWITNFDNKTDKQFSSLFENN